MQLFGGDYLRFYRTGILAENSGSRYNPKRLVSANFEATAQTPGEPVLLEQYQTQGQRWPTPKAPRHLRNGFYKHTLELGDSRPDGITDKLGLLVNIQLRHRAVSMGVNGIGGKLQDRRHFLVAVALRD